MCYILCVSIALVLQHSNGMRRIVLASVTCPALQYIFHIISHIRHDFRAEGGGGEFVEHIMCIFILCAAFVCNVSHSKQNSASYYSEFT
jgi:hypothetical protein